MKASNFKGKSLHPEMNCPICNLRLKFDVVSFCGACYGTNHTYKSMLTIERWSSSLSIEKIAIIGNDSDICIEIDYANNRVILRRFSNHQIKYILIDDLNQHDFDIRDYSDEELERLLTFS
jgi:hypothetical protein